MTELTFDVLWFNGTNRVPDVHHHRPLSQSLQEQDDVGPQWKVSGDHLEVLEDRFHLGLIQMLLHRDLDHERVTNRLLQVHGVHDVTTGLCNDVKG